MNTLDEMNFEAVGDDIDDTIERLDRLTKEPGHLRPVAMAQLSRIFGRCVDEAQGLADPYEMFGQTFAETSSEALAVFLLAALPYWDGTTGKLNKTLAIEVAEKFGRGNAQLLYRFAVLVTKLA